MQSADDEPATLRSQVTSGLRWITGVRLASQLVSWVVTIFVLRILTPADYGLLAMAMVFVDFLAMMSQFGVGAALIQSPTLDERKLRQMLGFAILVNTTLFAVLFLAAPLIAAFFNSERLVPMVRVIGCQFLITVFGLIPSSRLTRSLNFKAPAVVDMSGVVAGSLLTLGLAITGAGVWSLVWGNLATAAWKAVGVNVVSPFLRWPLFSFRGTRELLIYGTNVTATRILWFFYSQADVIIAGRLLGETLLGVYAVAMQLAQIPVARVASIVNEVSFPAFARIQDDQRRYAAAFLAAVRAMSFTIFPVLWGMSSIAPELVTVVLGEKWLAAIVPLQVLALILPVYMFTSFMNTAAMGMGRSDLPLKQVLLAVLVMPFAFLVGVKWGVVGLAVAWVAAFPFVFAGAMRLFLPAIGLQARDLLRAMARPILASLGMYAMVILARTALGPAVPGVARLAELVFIGVAGYGVFTSLINRSGYREMMGAIRG